MNVSPCWSRFRHSARGTLCTFLLATLPCAFSAQPPPPGEIISLPPLMVEEKGAPLVWRYLATPEVEIVSVCEPETIIAFAERYHRLDELLQTILPPRFHARKAGPDENVIFNEVFGRARSQEVIAEMLQRPLGKSSPESPGSRPGRSGLPPAGARIQFLPNMRISDGDMIAVFSIFRDSTETAAQFVFAAERITSLLNERVPRLPDWFVAGTIGVFTQTKFNDSEIELQAAEWSPKGEAKVILSDLSRSRTLFALEDLLSHRPSSRGASAEADELWSAQCALFVRWALTRKDGAEKEALWKFVDRLEKEPLSEALFREHFGLGFADMRDRLSDYLPVVLRERLQLDVPKSVPLRRLRVRLATDGEVARIRGGWERKEIAYVRRQFPGLVDKYVEQARATLQRGYDKGDRDPRLLAELGLTEMEVDNLTQARDFLEAAVKADVPRPSAYYQLALLRFKALSTLPDSADKLTTDQAASILTPLLATRRFQPPIMEVYLLMSEVLKRRETPPTPEQLAQLNEGVRLFPSASSLVMRAIGLNIASGQIATALDLADVGAREARDPVIGERLQRVREELASPPK